MTDLVFYKDEKFTNPFTIDDIGDVDAGDIRFVHGWLKNESNMQIVQIEPEVLDEDITVIDLPKELHSKRSQKVTIRYAPKENREEALNTFITFWGKKRIPPE
jgi:hypothetical protein